jgi:hypothetical protein
LAFLKRSRCVRTPCGQGKTIQYKPHERIF